MKRIALGWALAGLLVGVGQAAETAAVPQKPPSPARTTDQVEFRIGPVYADAPELAVKDGVPKGELKEFTMNSEDSRIYPGIKAYKPAPYKRKVWVYVPAGCTPDTELPFIIVQDGEWYRIEMSRILDNMIHEKRLPALAAIYINSGGGDSHGSERGLEYDTVSDRYVNFIEGEVLPKITHDLHVALTKDPEGRATMGGSSGGAAAFSMAWFRPDLYHRVLTYSGTYVNQQSPSHPAIPQGAWGYHQYIIGASERKPLRIWLEISENDNGSKQEEKTLHNWVLANRRMADVLKDKGYTYRYVFAEAAGHTDGRVTRQTLPEALDWLWDGYKTK